MSFRMDFERRIPKVKSVYADVIEELERQRVTMYLQLISEAMAKRQQAEKKFMSDYKSKDSVIKEYSKYERIVYYLFMRMNREIKKYASA